MHFVSTDKAHRVCEKLVIHIAASMHVPFQRPKRSFNVHHLPTQEFSLLFALLPRLSDHVSDKGSSVLHLFLSQRKHFFSRLTNEGVEDSCVWCRHAFADIVSQMLGRTGRTERVQVAYVHAQYYLYFPDTIHVSSSIFLLCAPHNIAFVSHDIAQGV